MCTVKNILEFFSVSKGVDEIYWFNSNHNIINCLMALYTHSEAGPVMECD